VLGETVITPECIAFDTFVVDHFARVIAAMHRTIRSTKMRFIALSPSAPAGNYVMHRGRKILGRAGPEG